MSILTSHQRAVVHADTGVDSFIIDRVADAFDSLTERDDVEGFKRCMATAIAQMGYRPKPEDKPTAVDKIYLICIVSLADKRGWTRPRSLAWVKNAVKG